MFYSVYDDAVEVVLKIEVKVLKSLADDAHSDVKERVELQDVDGLDVVAVPEAEAHQAHNIGCDHNRVRPVGPLCPRDLNFNGRVHRFSSVFEQLVCYKAEGSKPINLLKEVYEVQFESRQFMFSCLL